MNKDGLTVDYINGRIADDAESFISECEREYEDEIGSVTDRICKNGGHSIVMLAGPSSSGKTTTAGMLRKSIGQRGIHAVTVSLDDFYLTPDKMPTDANGVPDFEAVESLDLPYITECLLGLDRGGRFELPVFSFDNKCRETKGREVVLEDKDIIIVEGLHSLNPAITDALPAEKLVRLYISASSRIYDGDEMLLSKREVRLVRRLIRDFHHRGSSVEYTFELWKAVRRGEDKYLFPFSSLADVKINTMHPYEPCVMRDAVIPLLSSLPEDSPYSQGARALLEKLSAFVPLGTSYVPKSSLLMEFLG